MDRVEIKRPATASLCPCHSQKVLLGHFLLSRKAVRNLDAILRTLSGSLPPTPAVSKKVSCTISTLEYSFNRKRIPDCL